jgi:Predicted membrane protein
MTLRKRWFIFICGLFCVAFGISCFVASKLGTATISSAPYVLSLRYPISLGGFTFIVNMAFLLAQIAILRRKFNPMQLLQIPMTGIFGCFIDFTLFLLSFVAPETYIGRFAMMLAGVGSMALGIALEIIGNVVVLPGEGIVNAIAAHWRFDFGKTKTGFDLSIVLLAACLSWGYFGEVHGIREGTLVAALITGSVARFFIKHLSQKGQNGSLILRLPFAAEAR